MSRLWFGLRRTTFISLLTFPLACGGSGERTDETAPSAHTGEAGEAAEGPGTSGAESEEEIQKWMHLDTRDFPLLIWSAQIIHSDYHAPERFNVATQINSALDSLERELPEFFTKRTAQQITVSVGSASKSFELPTGLAMRDAASWLEGVLVFTRDELKLEGEALHELEYAALNGFVAPLDPHTILLTPREHADLGVKTRGHFGGIGIRVFAADRYIVVDEVLSGTPAQKAGLLAGDLIIKIDAQSTVNMPIVEARDLLRGPEGSTVKVVVQRDGKGKLTIPIERAVIRIESVESHRLEGDVGYLRISTFQADTGAKVGEAIAKMNEGTALRGLVLDLRGNAGGLLTQATELLDHLVSEGELVIVRSAMGREAQAAKPPVTLGAKVPVVVLVDEGSASAAEIVGGGIVHLGRGIVLGRTSFGKGTVQMLKPSTPYGKELGLKLTVAEYRVAGDSQIQSRGVTPDLQLIPVRLQEIAGVAAAYDDERFERERERYITRHLPSSKGEGPKAQTPAFSLRYLSRQWELKEGEALPMRDPEVRLAHELATRLDKRGTRAGMLAALGTIAEELRTREDQAVAAGMEDSWGKPARWAGAAGLGGAASLKLSAQVLKPEGIAPGDPFSVKISVTNEGTNPVDRVHVISECQEDELDGIEYFFGSLAPGETRSETLHLAMSAWHPARYEKLSFDAHVGEPDPEPDARAELAIDLEAPKRPQLAFSYWIVDDPKLARRAPKRPSVDPRLDETPFEIIGNGDGRLQPGEQVLLAFEVHNLGPGESKRSLLRVRNLSRTQALLEEGELSLGAIGAGERASGSIGMTVGAQADPQLPIDLAVIAGDAILRETVEGQLHFELQGDRPPLRQPSGKGDAMVLAPSFGLQAVATRVDGDTVVIEGVATHPRAVKDVVAWVQGPGGPLTDRKADYVANTDVGADSKAAGSLAFRFEVALEPGSNEITLVARDPEGVEARKDLAVFRGR